MSSLPPLSAYTPDPAQVDLTNSIGAITVGVFIAMTLTGLSLNQTVFYYRNFAADPLFVKYTVGVACTLNLLHSILLPKCLYFWTVTHWGSTSALDFVDWSYNVNLALNGLLSLVVQLFFAWRVFVLSHRRLPIPLIIAALSLAQAGWAIACTIVAFRLVRQSDFGAFTYGVDAWMYCAAAADILIAGTVVYYLRNAKTDFSKTNSIIDKLIAVTLESNLLTAVASIIVAILFSTIRNWPNAVNFVAVRLYFISLMVNVNARHELAKDLQNSKEYHMSPVGERDSRSKKMLSGVRVVSKTVTETDGPFEGGPTRHISMHVPSIPEEVGFDEESGVVPGTYRTHSGSTFVLEDDAKKSSESF